MKYSKKYLITGGAGFIGSHLAERLLANGAEVIVLDNLSNGFESNVPARADLVVGDAGNPDLLKRILPGCDAIFHLAAISSVQDSIDRPMEVHDINLKTTLCLLEAARNHSIKRFIFSSSAAVYGDTGGDPAREDMNPRPLSHYAIQKLSSEYYCSVYQRLYGITSFCLRYFNIFGQRQRADSPYSGVIAKFIDVAKKGGSITIYGDGSQTRDFCPVADVVSANIAAATVRSEDVAGGIFNIGSGRSISVKDLATSIRKLFPASGDIVFAPARSGEIHSSVANISRARLSLGFEPAISFEDAIKDLTKFSVSI